MQGGAMTSQYVTAIVPVRALHDGKTRLAGVLSLPRRAALVRSMLERVLAALRGAQRIQRIIVVTPDEHLPLPAGVARLLDQSVGLNPAIELAISEVSRRSLAREGQPGQRASDAVLIIPADAPQVSSYDIDTLIKQAENFDVAVVPDRHGRGTNGLWLRLPTAIPMQFGADSAEAHMAAARRLGVRVTGIEVAGLSHDVDEPADLGAEPMPEELARLLADEDELAPLLLRASSLAQEGFGQRVSYSRKVFIPLTHWCRDVCHYCTFAAPPRKGDTPFMTIEQVLEIARQGAEAGCDEALFTLGDKPELRYPAARRALADMGFASTLDYLAYCAQRVFMETGLLPHLNPGVMSTPEIARLREVSVSMGIMMESTAERLSERGGPHHRSPDKEPRRRLATLEAAGELAVPFTTGILIGIGETRLERIETLLAIRRSHLRHGHVQEIIIQNFRAKPGTRMASAPEPDLKELQWTIAVARLIFGPQMSIQAPPNLSEGQLTALVAAGINDWGGVSPVTPDHVNPEAPWPQLTQLARETRAAGRWLVQRLALAPRHALALETWVNPRFHTAVRRRLDADGYRAESTWYAGSALSPPAPYLSLRAERVVGAEEILTQAESGAGFSESQLLRLFSLDGEAWAGVTTAADQLRSQVVGDEITYVVNRNINYTNICTHRCGFCAFAKGRSARSLRGPGYLLDFDEIGRRVAEAREHGATEVCLQGGIHPSFDGNTYLQIVKTAKAAAPDIHVHAFSPLEIWHGAQTLNLSLSRYLGRLAEAGLRSLPGTAAEILCDEVRAVICPDKIQTDQWLTVMREAHAVGLRSTATIMFGHVERPIHWVRHLRAIRALQEQTGGFTEFVPLPFVHQESPLWRQGQARSGPSWREALLMHAVARLALEPVIRNVQVSWVKMGRRGAIEALQSGANDLGGVLMNESITRAAGGVNGQQMTATEMRELIRSIHRQPRERTTLYGVPAAEPWSAAGCLGDTRPLAFNAALV